MANAAGTATSKWSSVGSTFQNIGSKISNVGGSLTKGITLPAVGAAGAVGGITAALGWGRLRSIDSANAQLKGLGYSAKDVENISGQVATALEGGMMTLGEGTRVAAGGLAAGVEQGKELEKYIGLVDAAAIGMNTSVDETAMIFNRVQGSGKVMTEELQMVEQRMPGFSNALQEHIGVASDDEFKKMVTAGEVGSDAFLETMDTFAGDMAKEHAKSFDGLVDLAKAYVGQIGEAMLGGVFEQSKDSIAEFVDWLSDPGVQAKAAELGKTIGDVFSKVLGVVKNVITWFMGLPAPIQKTALVIGGIAVAAGPVLLVLGTMASTIGTLITTFGAIAGVIAKIPAPLNILGGLFRMISPLLGLLKVGLMAVGGAMKALWLTMMANPIVLIIAAVVAVVAALVWFFTQTETGKEIWSNFMDWLGTAWEWIKTTAVTVFNAIVDTITGAWTWIKDKTTEIWDTVVNWIKDNWSTIVDFLALLSPVTAVIRHWDKIKAVTSAVWTWIVEKIKAVWTSIITAVTNAVDKVKTWISNAWNKIKSTTSNIWNGIKTVMKNAIVKAVMTVMNKVNQIKSKMQNAWNRVKSITSNAFNGVKNAVSNGINGAVNFVRNLPGRALSALGNIGSKLYNSGWSMIQGFKDGIVSAFNNAVNAVKNGLNRIRNFFPFSPAKEGPFSGKGWTWYSGQSMSEGLADGMASGTSDVVRQSEALMKAAAFDAPSIPGMTRPSSSASGLDEDTGPTSNINFHITNPVAEPTSETARKASAYIGVSI
ncbi:phage tail protein [Brevibacterium aurantiacum]|uniref:phage tail protein n=1 Tax=Brevibacterium aurantiacum TaxID=273384 RepID=UPI0018676D78|nr:tape measure protein [Brevibacterium aurantiacum]